MARKIINQATITSPPRIAKSVAAPAQPQNKAEKKNQFSHSGDSFPIVGIGASAGGLEALEQFFSHMPKSSFGRWVRALYGCLKSPGYLLFTTHGQKSCSMQSITPDDIPADGFWFRAASEQHDLDTAEYGTSITTPDFVIGEIYRQTGARIVAYRQAGWWEHQDLYVLKREA